MKCIFIGGIPTAGKSHLAKNIAESLGMLHCETDTWRDALRLNPRLRAWIDFYIDKDEEEYWRTTDCETQWENLVRQSEALWPPFLAHIKEIQKEGKSAIFEGVNLLPHLAARDLNFPGIYLLGESYEAVLERNKKDPRWGATEDLQIQEAQAFWNCERKWYAAEAAKYGFKTFANSADAEKTVREMIKE